MRRGTPKFRLLSCEAAVEGLRARIPFRYGSACLRAVPVLLVKVEIESTGRKRATGFTADSLPPRWFDKDPARSYRQNVDDMLAAFRIARDAWLGASAKSSAAWELWEAAYPRVVEESARGGLNPLTASFGSSFLERAVIDAVCRLKGSSFDEALRQDMLGLRTSRDVPPAPVVELFCRHTVGLGDPLTVGEIPGQKKAGDGLPRALEEDIEVYGLRYFKVKLRGDPDGDLDRLTRLAVLLNQRCRGRYKVTLDGNEQYETAAPLEALVEALRSRPYGQEFLDAVLYVEQPFRREVALQPAIEAEVARLSRWKPLIIDESDDGIGAFEAALKLGYRGVSHKNCKGVFKSLLNRAAIRRHGGDGETCPCFQTGEDLAAVPVLALQQDLASLASLGVLHTERNGHHYFHGLDHLPPAEAASALEAHPDLYEQRGGSVFLKIEDGMIRARSLQAPGYGYSCRISFEDRVPLDRWSFDMLGPDAEQVAETAPGS